MSGRAPTPWTSAQVRIVAACDLVAALVVGTAAHGAGRRGSLGDQIAWIDVAVVALVVVVVANGALFLVGRRAVGARRRRLLPDAIPAPEPVARPDGATGPWWWVPGTLRAHTQGCPLVLGKHARSLTAAEVRRRRLQRCEVCG